MPLHDNELARREDGELILRAQPLRVRWVLNELATSDGHHLQCVFTCSVKALDPKAERQMLEETFLGARPIVTTNDVVHHFTSALHSAAEKMSAKHPAEQWTGETTYSAMIASLRKAAETVAFSCGLEMLPPFQVDIESPSFRRERLAAMQRQLAEQRAAGQAEHFTRAAELLKQFESMRHSVPGLSPGRVLQEISPLDRGEMLQTLLMASASEATNASLWAVAGPNLLRIDPRVSPPSVDVQSLSTELGPLRSVQAANIDGRRMLLIGARSGVMLLDPAASKDARLFADPDFQASQGFNHAVIWNGQIWASHGEAGIVSWNWGETDRPSVTLRPAKLTSDDLVPAPRNLDVIDENQLIFSSGQRLFTINRAGEVNPLPLEPRSDIVSILPMDTQLAIIHANGDVCRRERATLETICQDRRCGAIVAAGILPWLGSRRLLLATDEGPVYCIGTEDELVTQYLSPHRGLRMISASADTISAVSSDRQRLILWKSWDARKPYTDIHVTSHARHRIADIDFA